MKTALMVALFALLAPSAQAQEWQQFSYPDQGFAISFPGQPQIRDSTITLAAASNVPARLYSLTQGANEYRLTVADFSAATTDDDTIINQAADALRATGTVSVDIQARVRRNYGRQLAVTTKDGSHSVAAVFLVNHHLFRIEGITHPANGGGDSSGAARFQQSLDFIGANGGDGYGFGGRYRF
jgi:hypothetical protein